MINENSKDTKVGSVARVIASLFGLPWIEILAEASKLAYKMFGALAYEGTYEVLELECMLELLDRGGKKARFTKRKKVRYLQNETIAHQDYGWADGKYFIDYQVTPGVAVDRYKAGYKHYVLISLREIKNRGDTDEFHIQWKLQDSFLKPDGFWQTDVPTRTKYLKIGVIFPVSRPPKSVRLVENNIRRTSVLDSDSIKKLPDGRWKVTWETAKPHLYEQYVLQWDW